MNIKYWILIGILGTGILFLGLDNCGSTAKYNKLKGEYETYYKMSRVVVHKALEEIGEQDKEIVALDEKITYLHGIIEVKDADLADKEEELGVIKRDFESLEACQSQYDKLSIAFTLCKEINIDKDTLMFSLNEKYEAQLVISISYKDMYESVQGIVDIRTKQVKELEKINKRLRFSSGLKSGLAVVLAGLIVYNMVK